MGNRLAQLEEPKVNSGAGPCTGRKMQTSTNRSRSKL